MLLLLLPILRLYISHFEHSAILRYKDHKIVDLYCKARVFVQIVVGGIQISLLCILNLYDTSKDPYCLGFFCQYSKRMNWIASTAKK
jgi:hypothetical protein